MPLSLTRALSEVNTLMSNEMPHNNNTSEEAKAIQADYTRLLSLNTNDPAFSALLTHIQSSVRRYKQSLFPETADYTTLFEEHNIAIGLAERKGMRSKQEDYLAVAVSEIQAFEKLSTDKQQNALEQTFHVLQKKYGQRTQVGSTACTSIAWLTQNDVHITTANLGDSAAYLIVIDTTIPKQVTLVKRLNTLHNLDPKQNPYEFERVSQTCRQNDQKAPYANIGLSSDSGLSVSRAFGDCEDETYGLSHHPEIQHYQHRLQANEKAFILNACDGLLDNNALTLEKIGQLILEQNDAPLDKLAEHLVNSAYNNGSEDNISVSIAVITETPISLSIFDGHGSDIVAREIGSHFYETLAQRISHAYSTKLNKRSLTLSLYSTEADETDTLSDPIQNGISAYPSQHSPLLFTGSPLSQKRYKTSPTITDTNAAPSPVLRTPHISASFSLLDIFLTPLDGTQRELFLDSQATTQTTSTPTSDLDAETNAEEKASTLNSRP